MRVAIVSKLIKLASKKVYYFSKNLTKVYFVYPHIPSIRALVHTMYYTQGHVYTLCTTYYTQDHVCAHCVIHIGSCVHTVYCTYRLMYTLLNTELWYTLYTNTPLNKTSLILSSDIGICKL